MDKEIQGKHNREWGAEAEKIAYDWLLTHGYVIRETNWRIKNTIEVDIIAEIPGTIVFVEVKARKDRDAALEAVDSKKIRKMVRAADTYLKELDKIFQYRFDIITIIGTKDNYTFEHIPDAFYPPLNFK